MTSVHAEKDPGVISRRIILLSEMFRPIRCSDSVDCDCVFFFFKPPGPFNHVKSSLLGSTSDSNINKYSTINRIPLIALNFSEGTEKKTHSPQTSEKTIIAPKVKDRTHNVTEKVTQVSQYVTLSLILKRLLWSVFPFEKKACEQYLV